MKEDKLDNILFPTYIYSHIYNLLCIHNSYILIWCSIFQQMYVSSHLFLYRHGFKYILGIVALGLKFWILLNFARKKYFCILFSLSWNPKFPTIFKKSLMLLHLLSTSATHKVPLQWTVIQLHGLTLKKMLIKHTQF